MNAQDGREQRQFCGQRLGFRPTTTMISRLPSKVNNLPHLADFAALRDCSVVEVAPAARLKALLRLTIALRIAGHSCDKRLRASEAGCHSQLLS
jgi:hypothetical protein